MTFAVINMKDNKKDQKFRRPHPTAQAFFDSHDNDQVSSNRGSDLVQKRLKSLGWRSRYSQETEYPIHMLQNSVHFSVQQMQRGEIEGTFGTGATVWPASLVLMKYLEKHPAKVRHKSVVDLGAGTGVTSLAAAVLGAQQVVCTDGIESVVSLALDNVRRASQQQFRDNERNYDNIRVCQYWWGSGSLQNETFDVILVSDCVLPKLYPIEPLVDALVELMKSDSIAILSYEHRHYAQFHPAKKFQELAASRGLKVHIVPSSELDSVYSLDDIEIWEVTRC
jgi:predicted nicotinamide N-methyase